jgi:hypothetical protein
MDLKNDMKTLIKQFTCVSFLMCVAPFTYAAEYVDPAEAIQQLNQQKEANDDKLDDLHEEVENYFEDQKTAELYGEEPWIVDDDDYVTGSDYSETLDEGEAEFLEKTNDEIERLEQENQEIDQALTALGAVNT